MSYLCLALSAGILVFILRYRVHIHITYSDPASTRRKAKKGSAGRPGKAGANLGENAPCHCRLIRTTGTPVREGSGSPRQATTPEIDTPDLVSALRNLGARPAAARAAAIRAAAEAGNFDERLKLAIRYATEAA